MPGAVAEAAREAVAEAARVVAVEEEAVEEAEAAVGEAMCPP